MPASKHQILDQFHVVRRQRDTALRELSQAQETIAILDAELTALKYHGDLAYAKVADEQGVSKRQIERAPDVKFLDSTAWIDDIWFCSPENAKLLGPAEKEWKEHVHNPQAAIILVTEALKTNPIKQDRLTCKLFMAAIQFEAGQLEPACALVNECIRECGTDPRFKDTLGLASYIRGRIFVAMAIYPPAHWDFSVAVFTKNYHEQAIKWQGFCESLILQDEGLDPNEGDSESTSGDSTNI
jgi:hypothetical protein